MKLTFHKNCRTKLPHEPEFIFKVKNLTEAMDIIKRQNVTQGFLDWHKIPGHHYIVFADYVEDYFNYKSLAKTKIIKRSIK